MAVGGTAGGDSSAVCNSSCKLVGWGSCTFSHFSCLSSSAPMVSEESRGEGGPFVHGSSMSGVTSPQSHASHFPCFNLVPYPQRRSLSVYSTPTHHPQESEPKRAKMASSGVSAPSCHCPLTVFFKFNGHSLVSLIHPCPCW